MPPLWSGFKVGERPRRSLPPGVHRRCTGGLVSVVELLGQTSFDSDQKLTRLSLDFLALMVKRSPASTAVIAKVRGIDLVVQASRRHLANARVFSSALALLERLCASRLAIGKVLDNGFVQFIYDALAQYKFVYKTFVVLMRMLRNVASVEDGARVIQDSGGFDAILALIDHHLMKPAAVRLACLVLWHLQRHHGAAAPDSIYNLKSNFLPLKFPNDDAPDVDDGYASDDSCSDVDDDDRAGEAAGADPAPGSSPIDADFDPVHFSPELWDPRDPASIAFFNRYRSCVPCRVDAPDDHGGRAGRPSSCERPTRPRAFGACWRARTAWSWRRRTGARASTRPPSSSSTSPHRPWC